MTFKQVGILALIALIMVSPLLILSITYAESAEAPLPEETLAPEPEESLAPEPEETLVPEPESTAPAVTEPDVTDPELTDPEVGKTKPFTWTYLATIAGATAATLLIVQFIKLPLDKVWKIPTRLVVYVIALIIMLIATALTSGLNVNNSLLAVVNAFVVSLAAYGSYELTFAKLQK